MTEAALEQHAEQFNWWSPALGQVFENRFAFDIETTLIDRSDPSSVPDYVLGGAFDGERGYFVRRQHLAAFLRAHPGQQMIYHHAAFDLKVIDKLVPSAEIYDRVETNQVFDTRLLHQLYTLATDGHPATKKGQATLEHCVDEYLAINLPKDVQDSDGDVVRTTYHKWLDARPDEIEAVYLRYLAKDVVVTYALFTELDCRINSLLASCSGAWGFVSETWLREQVEQWGPLTHHIQLKAAVVLDAITRNGIHIDQARRDELAAEIATEIDALLAQLKEHDYAPGPGSDKRLQEILRELDEQHPDLEMPRTKTGKYASDRDSLAELAPRHPFLAALDSYKQASKLQSTYLNKMDRPVVHPSFGLLTNAGRTSSFGQINAQNLPRDGRIRSCFVPSPGHVFIDADYSTVELATLAQACISQFGLESKMADAINAGQDLHRLVAARVAGKDPAAVTSDERQRAKAINFGKPGGMGHNGLKIYAYSSYGIELDDAQVEELSDAWFAMFPEMKGFLDDSGESSDTGLIIAQYFDLTPRGIDDHTGNTSFAQHASCSGCEDDPDPILGLMCIKVMGQVHPVKRSGAEYTPEEIDYFWTQLAGRLADLPSEAYEQITQRQPSAELRRAILSHLDRQSVFTLTGRLLANAAYCARHNTVFQGLAADGAKLTLWKLWRAGYRIVNFIHDEVLIEVPEDDDLRQHADKIQEIMIAGMEQVVPDVAVRVEYAAAMRWYKNAKAVLDPRTGDLTPWKPLSANAGETGDDSS